ADLLKFQQGELDSYLLRGQDLATLLPEAESKDFSIWNGGPSILYPFIIFNQSPENIDLELKELFSKREFRYAISALIDRETIIDQTLNGLAEPQMHLFGPNNRYFNPQHSSSYSYYREGAKELLVGHDLIDHNGDGIRELPSGKPLEFTIITPSNDSTVQDILNIIISDLEEAGIKAKIEVIDQNLWIQKLLNTYDWECTIMSGKFPTFPEQWYNVWRSDGNMHYWYPKQEEPATEWEAQVDELYNALIYTYDPLEIQSFYDQFQNILMEELPMIPLYNRYSFYAVYNKWGNINWDSLHKSEETITISMGFDWRRVYLKELME
ncbi:MAG: ABC transporter substrate-binding protein, partial [Spirochaetaceae bacterium]|nr:ABC transporter substrate-binding protein [Spirochaetaceae bacterium]